MTSSTSVMHEVESNLEVILLLIFMVAGIQTLRALTMRSPASLRRASGTVREMRK
jgi:Na+/H+ antiporter NhaB